MCSDEHMVACGCFGKWKVSQYESVGWILIKKDASQDGECQECHRGDGEDCFWWKGFWYLGSVDDEDGI